MKEFANELWYMLRQAVASVLAAIGFFIGLPGLVLNRISDAFISASSFVALCHKGAYEAPEDEDTDLVYT